MYTTKVPTRLCEVHPHVMLPRGSGVSAKTVLQPGTEHILWATYHGQAVIHQSLSKPIRVISTVAGTMSFLQAPYHCTESVHGHRQTHVLPGCFHAKALVAIGGEESSASTLEVDNTYQATEACGI